MDGEKLAENFKMVDLDGNRTLDFSEYLALMCLFSNQEGSFSLIFRHPTNAEFIKASFDLMQRCLQKYDHNGNRMLSYVEVGRFFLLLS